MRTRVETPQSRCRAGFARADVTLPAGIYHRMWGAALHDRATGTHRPLTATALWLEPADGGDRLLVLGLDHCNLDRVEMDSIRRAVAGSAPLAPEQVHVALSHTHGSGWMSRTRSHLPGGELIGPYLDRLAESCAALAAMAGNAARPATLVYGTARCSLAAHRDYPDEATGQFVCGFNDDPPGRARPAGAGRRALTPRPAYSGSVRPARRASSRTARTTTSSAAGAKNPAPPAYSPRVSYPPSASTFADGR